MAYQDDRAEEPFRTYEPYQPASSATASQRPATRQPHLSHRVSAMTIYSDDNSYPQLHGRESMVSLDSYAGNSSPPQQEYDGHSYTAGSGWSASFGYNGAGGSYAPVSAAGPPPSRFPSRAKRAYGSSLGRTIPEESTEDEAYDLSLLGGAAPMGHSGRYDPIKEDEDDVSPGFDLSAALGPMTSHDEVFVKKLQAQEASGMLTGGLGQGFHADVKMRDAELLSSTPSVQRSLSRSFSRRKPPAHLGRFETIRQRGQDEANRKGEVIEVILEEGPGADLSSIEGLSTVASNDFRRSTFPTKEGKTEIFYPQPNWKPPTMRWPYLTLLITISVGLAIAQEYLFQRFHKKPIVKFRSPKDIDAFVYFAIKFLPTVVAVTFGVFWQFTDFEVRRLEAFYQLSRQQGALASKSINADYVTSYSFWRPFRAIKLGHYAVALSSFASTLAVSLVPTCAAASIILTPSRKERMENPSDMKEIFVASVWSRLLTVTLVLCAAMGCGLLYVLQTRRSGLLSDVRGIAGLASMAVVSHVLMDFKDMDTAKHKDIHQKLKRRRYMLRNSSLAPYDGTSTKVETDSEQDDGAHLSEHPHPLMLRPMGCIPFIIGLILFAALIPTFLFTPAQIVTDKAAWVVTALAVMLKLCWGAMETSVRMMEPYYILSKRHAHSKVLTLDYTALPFAYMPLRALLNGHFLVFLVGFGSVMAEFLTILVTSLATVDGQDFITGYGINKYNKGKWKDDKEDGEILNSGQETIRSFYITLGATLFILIYMFVVSNMVFFRRRHPFLPRQPNTIASILAFIHQSKMLYNFVGTSKLNNTEMAKKLDDGKTYGLGWFTGRDGQTHCGVDQEELTSSYKHGVDYTTMNNPWNAQWDVL
ncbi:Protein of unknown function DUF3433 [Fusarium oxysporum f. sp. vasinfectum]|uniref:Spray n=1 Tax=Fusarium oxysporum f. sp. vasinfectum 25433 TaxID=1089449 RepID=X0MH81_FUSOX|nr:hypothetical protein FOTG_03069 [Fusarium oxysporum f. sp. vasinfectum 25433]KAK2934508.1 Protein of unknown function DUF3433 [Fusarium oxysporum f. sp. vasinfectum]